MRLQDILSTISESMRPFLYFHLPFVYPLYLLSNFRVSARTFVNFCQLSVRPRYFMSTSVKFLSVAHSSVSFCQLSLHPLEFPSSSVNFLCILRTFPLFVPPLDLPSTFPSFLETFVNFRQLSMHPLHLLSTFCVSTKPSINFC